MKVARFEARCKDCATVFLVPSLSDLLYGEFIAKGQFGKGFLYLNAFEEEAWAVINEITSKFCSQDKNKGHKEALCFQEVVGKCIDKIDGEEFSITSGPVCPKCFGSKIDYHDGKVIDFLEIPKATFNEFMSLKEEERKKLVEKLWYSNL